MDEKRARLLRIAQSRHHCISSNIHNMFEAQKYQADTNFEVSCVPNQLAIDTHH
jgi:hypothetical protein